MASIPQYGSSAVFIRSLTVAQPSHPDAVEAASLLEVIEDAHPSSAIEEAGAAGAVEMSAPAQGLVRDVLLIVGPGHEGATISDDGKDALDHFREICRARGLNLIVVGDGKRDVDLDEIRALKADGKLSQLTPAILWVHGAERDGIHYIGLRDGASQATAAFLAALKALDLVKVSVHACMARHSAKNIAAELPQGLSLPPHARYRLGGGSWTTPREASINAIEAQLIHYCECLEARRTPSDVEETLRAMQDSPLCLCVVTVEGGEGGKLQVTHFPAPRPDEMGPDEIRNRIGHMEMTGADGRRADANSPGVQRKKEALSSLHGQAENSPGPFDAAAQQRHKNMALLNAVRRGKLSKVMTFLENGADPKFRYGGGPSMLAVAVKFGHAGVVSALLKEGVLTDSAKLFRHLAKAADEGHGHVVDALLGRCAGPDSPLARKEDLMFEAIEKGHTKLVRALLERGVDANCSRGGIPVLTAAVCKWQFDTVERLLEKGAQVTVEKANTVLNLAMGVGSIGLLKALAEKGGLADDELIDKAVSARRYDLATVLLGGPATLPQAKLDYWLILVCGIDPLSPEKLALVAKLLDEGAMMDDYLLNGWSRNGDHHRVLNALCAPGDFSDAKLDSIGTLLKRGAKAEKAILNEPLLRALMLDHAEALRDILAHGGDAEYALEGYSLLEMAVMQVSTRAMRVLLEVDSGLVEHPTEGPRPLFLAIHKGNEEMVKVLLEHGAATHLTWQEKTCMQFAAERGHANIEKLLKEWPGKAAD